MEVQFFYNFSDARVINKNLVYNSIVRSIVIKYDFHLYPP